MLIGRLFTIAARARRIVFRTLRVRTRGVRVIVTDPDGRVLLVRHSYGPTRWWLLPGGGIKRGEAPAAAGRREVAEEAGCTVGELCQFGVYEWSDGGWRDTVYLMVGDTTDVPEPDGYEVVEARFFALDALPENVARPARRRIAEWRGERAIDTRW